MPKQIEHDPEHDARALAFKEVEPGDKKFMRLAIEQAWIGKRTHGGGEVGCVIVMGGKVVSAAHNETVMGHDPTAHAEIVALRKLGATLQAIEFRGATVYSTLQCCTMCTAACIWAKVSRIVYGATRNDVHSMYFDARELNTADLIAEAFKDDIRVVGGVLASECCELYVGPDETVPVAEQTNQ